MGTIVDKYLDRIVQFAARGGVWAYRGQRKAEWLLNSGATRRLMREHGDSIVEDPEFRDLFLNYHRDVLLEPARTRGYGIESGRNLTDLELLAKLQHFGAETGLMDFTWSPLVALWFASLDVNHDGKVFMMDTGNPIGIVKVPGDGSGQGFREVFAAPPGSQAILYWEPTSSGDATARILRQRSVFVVGRPFVSSTLAVIEEITVKKDDKEAILAELAILDLSEETLFQDVYGFAQASKRMCIPRLSTNAYRRRADNYYQIGEYENAIDYYSRSMAAGPTNGLTYLLRANVLSALGKHDEAVSDYDRASDDGVVLSLGIQDVVLYNRGNSKAELGDHQGAIEDYTEAIRGNPSNAQFYYNRGNAYLDLYRFQDALDDFVIAANMDGTPGPREINALHNEGIALLAVGKLPEALDVYRQGWRIDNDHEGVRQNLWALNRMFVLLQGLDYSLHAVPLDHTGNINLRISLPKGYEPVGNELQRLLLFGRIGNSGNTGGPGLVGGPGFNGKSLILIRVDRDGEEQ